MEAGCCDHGCSAGKCEKKARSKKYGKRDFKRGSPLSQEEFSYINNDMYVYMLFSGFDIEQVSITQQKALVHTHIRVY